MMNIYFSRIHRRGRSLFCILRTITIILRNRHRRSTGLNKQTGDNTYNKCRDKFDYLNPLLRGNFHNDNNFTSETNCNNSNK